MALLAGSGSYIAVREITIDPSSIPAFNVAVETFTVAALADIPKETLVRVSAASLETGVSLLGARMTATGVLELTFINTTNAAINPASQTFAIIVL